MVRDAKSEIVQRGWIDRMRPSNRCGVVASARKSLAGRAGDDVAVNAATVFTMKCTEKMIGLRDVPVNSRIEQVVAAGVGRIQGQHVCPDSVCSSTIGPKCQNGCGGSTKSCARGSGARSDIVKWNTGMRIWVINLVG